VCLVETSKASVELEAPGAGTIVQLFPAGAEVEPGQAIALVAESDEELAAVLERSARPRPAAQPAGPEARGRATRKAVELAALHGVDLDAIETPGFITAADVEALLAGRIAAAGPEAPFLAGVPLAGVTLPATLVLDGALGRVDPRFLEELRADPETFRSLPSAEKCDAYRGAGAAIGDGVVLEDGVLLDSPRIVLEARVRLGRGATVRCDETVAIGELTHVGPGLELTCRRAFLGAGVHAGRGIRIGGGGHRDPWATFVAGDTAFVGDEVFVNPCRPVVLGAEVYLTMRAMIVTHNIGHSVLEGFENRFAPVVLEDRSQVGLGSVVYAGCRIGREAIVASSSYVVSDVPAGKLAIGVPARVAGDAKRNIPRPRQLELAEAIVRDLAELLDLRGHVVSPLPAPAVGFELAMPDGGALVELVETVGEGYRPPRDAAETVVLTLGLSGPPPGGVVVLDLLGRTIHGRGGVVADSVREFCRKRGIRVAPGPWRYHGGLV
jgi:acetyltransferase-like isoleucine patch superfamily enzyme